MANYIKTQIFTNLRGGNADPTVFDTEFTAVQNAVNAKADTTGATFTGPVVLPANASGAQAAQAQEIPNLVFPAGTSMAFFQSAAPAGWVQSVANNDALLRVVSSAGGGAGGSSSVASGVIMPTTTLGHALIVNEMPSHTHTITGKSGAATQQSSGPNGDVWGNAAVTSSPTGGGAAHSHAISATNWTPKYIDMIICVKQ